MRDTLAVACLLANLAVAVAASAQSAPEPPPTPGPSAITAAGPPLQASNILNPNISVVGNLVAVSGDDPTLPDDAFELSEAELGLQASIDPYSRADVFIGFSAEGAELEEAYVTWLTLPGSLTVKAGKLRSNLGKLNRSHPPETPFVDRPLAAQRFFGEEGLSATGVSASYLMPTPFYLNLDFEVTTNWADAPLFGDVSDSGDLERGGGRSDLSYLARAGLYHDFTEETNLTYGLSWAHGVHDRHGERSSEVVAADATFRWKDPRRAVYRSLTWQTEAYFTRRSEAGGAVRAAGAYSYVEYQFARRWRSGLRGDYVEEPEEWGGLAYLTFWPSEFSALSLQGRFVRRFDGRQDIAAFLKLTFNIGPHGAHPF